MTTFVLVCAATERPPSPGACPVGQQAWVSVDEMVDYAALGITPESIAGTWAWGFASVLAIWALAIAVRAVIDVIRKA